MQSSSCLGNHQTYMYDPGCYNYRSECLRKCLSLYGVTNFMLKWIWGDSEGSYDDFCLGNFK